MGFPRQVFGLAANCAYSLAIASIIVATASPRVVAQQADGATQSTEEQSSWNAWERMTDEAAWALLPPVAKGAKQPLPNWVKPVALQMPRTAAAMIELDAAFRNTDAIDTVLRAKLRWIVANANQCTYGQQLALADLRRVAKSATPLSEFTGPATQWPAADADVFQFVKLLSTAAPTIPDSLFEKVRAKHGDRGVAAIVLLTAYANFQDRLLLGLGVPVEENGPYAPLNVTFAEGALHATPLTPNVNGAATYDAKGSSVVARDPSWNAIPYEELQVRLEKQRDRQPRLRVPQWDEVKSKLPAAMAVRPTGIRWSLINYGYAAELAIPWTLTTRTHWAEYPSDRILEESLFWVQTRALECNYCMGHCEMLLEVAGLSKQEVAKRTRLLADTDWAMFPPQEQRAYAYARKLTRAPKELTREDYLALEKDFGPRRAMSIFIWLCRGLYMTRISDGFQLPLERENVFGPSEPVQDDTSKSATTTVAANAEAREATDEEPLTDEAEAIVKRLRSTLDADSEAIAMLDDILKGSNLGAKDGWFPRAKVENRFDWQYALSRYDSDSDSKIAPDEFKGNESDFARLDRDSDGELTEADFDWSKNSLTPTPGLMMFFMSDHDANGKVTREEFSSLFEMLASGGDYLAVDDLRDAFQQSPNRSRQKYPDSPSRSTLVKALENQELGSLKAGPRLDEVAPDFTLTTLDQQEIQLSKVVGLKPTVLVFGNFTCGPFRSQAGNIEKLYERYKDRANFYLVYVREAHPSDGWWMQSNQRAGIDLKQPLDNGQRRVIAETCQKHLDLKIPFLVDTIDDQVGSTYSGMPNRLYLIDQQGRIAFKNGRGPFGFHPRQLEQALVLLLNEKQP